MAKKQAKTVEKKTEKTKPATKAPKVVNKKQTKQVAKEEPKKKKNTPRKGSKTSEISNQESNGQEFFECKNLLDENLKAKYEVCFTEASKKLKLNPTMIANAISQLKSLMSVKYSKSLDILSSESEEFLYLNFMFSGFPDFYSMKPLQISVPNSLYNKDYNTRVCLIVKDPKDEFKDLKLEFPFTLKVLDIKKIKLKYSRFNERRNLLKEYDYFICDGRVYLLLSKLLGKPFYAAKKYPVPISLDYSDPEGMKSNINELVLNSTLFYMSNGPNYTVKFARTVMSEDEIAENLKAVATQTLAHINKWGTSFDNFKTLSLKATTGNLPDFPLFIHLSEEEIKAYLNQ